MPTYAFRASYFFKGLIITAVWPLKEFPSPVSIGILSTGPASRRLAGFSNSFIHKLQAASGKLDEFWSLIAFRRVKSWSNTLIKGQKNYMTVMKEDTGSTLSAVVTALSHHFRRDATPLRAESNRSTDRTPGRARADRHGRSHQSST